MPPGEAPAGATAEAAARRSYGKLVAFLAARTRDLAGAEDALSEAFVAALEHWPARGVPDNPEAWLLATARRRMIDASRRRRTVDAASDTLRLLGELDPDGVAASIPDERLALMFACAHPALDAGVRAPLILQTVLGFNALTIASAFLVSPATMGQRLVRAKQKIRQAGIPFRIPEYGELGERLDGVLDAIYAVYAEGWSDPGGTEARRRNLADEAIWLGRLVVMLLPEAPEALGLLALMLHTHARRRARRNPIGAYVPLTAQDPSSWDVDMIEEAERLLFEASTRGAPGRYQLEAALQSAHVARRRTGLTDWAAIEQLYDALAGITDSPVVALNRAIAISHSRGAAAGLAALAALDADARLADYQPYWAARAELLARNGEPGAADAAYARAIGLERDPAVREFLQGSRDELHRMAG